MDATSFVQAMSSDPQQTLLESQLREMSPEQLMNIIRRKEKVASPDPSAQQKVRLADFWGRELAHKLASTKTAGLLDEAAQGARGVLRVVRKTPTASRVAIGAATGAAGGAVGSEPGHRLSGAVTGAGIGAATGYVAKPAARGLGRMLSKVPKVPKIQPASITDQTKAFTGKVQDVVGAARHAGEAIKSTIGSFVGK